MWNMTQHGFVSIVNKGGGLQVRARDKESLEAFCDLAKIDRSRIVEGGGTDYQFRVRRVSKRDVKRYVCAVVDGIDYDNFKNRAKNARGKKYADFLSRIWSAGWSLVDPEVRRREDALAKQMRARTPRVSSRWGEIEWDGEIEDEPRSIHSLTDDGWDALMREEPGTGVPF